MYYPMFYFDPTYILIVIGVVICLLASMKVKRTFTKYSTVRSASGLTGRDAAEQILHGAGIYDVRIEHVRGNLTDHYDPRAKVLRLSDATYHSQSVAAIGVAAHECGHAIQHATNYAPLTIRGAIVPIANFGSAIAWPLILIGLLFNSQSSALFLNLGILAFSAAVLFQIITLPVEFNASGRAIRILRGTGLLRKEEVDSAKKVLSAAALTYVAGALSSILQLLRILILTGGRRND
ncbi:zinc metallopeptidase [Lachnoclostridium sp. An181]|uniref:zinc metallopeptidase n=1 Tax=Lachnoclostridium sp. An181 TaxID=1965575 RepID=UPI000B3820F9|nr:zinc metallopeptidase [Lachnoclostridium sp. An181]OUP48685.1 peptidase [Lachnoclostridium sp. An181]